MACRASPGFKDNVSQPLDNHYTVKVELNINISSQAISDPTFTRDLSHSGKSFSRDSSDSDNSAHGGRQSVLTNKASRTETIYIVIGGTRREKWRLRHISFRVDPQGITIDEGDHFGEAELDTNRKLFKILLRYIEQELGKQWVRQLVFPYRIGKVKFSEFKRHDTNDNTVRVEPKPRYPVGKAAENWRFSPRGQNLLLGKFAKLHKETLLKNMISWKKVNEGSDYWHDCLIPRRKEAKTPGPAQDVAQAQHQGGPGIEPDRERHLEPLVEQHPAQGREGDADRGVRGEDPNLNGGVSNETGKENGVGHEQETDPSVGYGIAVYLELNYVMLVTFWAVIVSVTSLALCFGLAIPKKSPLHGNASVMGIIFGMFSLLDLFVGIVHVYAKHVGIYPDAKDETEE